MSCYNNNKALFTLGFKKNIAYYSASYTVLASCRYNYKLVNINQRLLWANL